MAGKAKPALWPVMPWRAANSSAAAVTRYQISPTYSDYRTALEFCRLAEGNADMHIVGIRRMEEGTWKPYRAIGKIKQEIKGKMQ